MDVDDNLPKATILVVDDQPGDLALVRAYLHGPRYSITTATNGNDALAKVAQSSFDLVILDVELPGRNGFDVCRALRGAAETREIPVLMLTALTEVADRAKGIECGADEFLSKPVDRAELQTRVKALLKARFYRQQMIAKNALLDDMLSRRYGEDAVARIKEDSRLLKLDGERKHVTVLFADVCGFTTYSELAPAEEVVQTLNQILTRLATVVRDNRGTCDTYMGDGVMAFYGAPISFGNDAANALKSAFQMQAAFQALRIEWHAGPRMDLGLGIGLSSGEVVVGAIGPEKLAGYTVIGDSVNVAARIQAEAEDGQILMSDATYALVPSATVARKIRDIDIKGRPKPVPIFELARPFPAA